MLPVSSDKSYLSYLRHLGHMVDLCKAAHVVVSEPNITWMKTVARLYVTGFTGTCLSQLRGRGCMAGDRLRGCASLNFEPRMVLAQIDTASSRLLCMWPAHLHDKLNSKMP